MKKIIYILALVICFISCSDKETQTVIDFPKFHVHTNDFVALEAYNVSLCYNHEPYEDFGVDNLFYFTKEYCKSIDSSLIYSTIVCTYGKVMYNYKFNEVIEKAEDIHKEVTEKVFNELILCNLTPVQFTVEFKFMEGPNYTFFKELNLPDICVESDSTYFKMCFK